MSDSGQNDIILGPPLTENALRSPALAKWSRQADFVKAPKSAWHAGADLAGYARAVGNFAYVVVRGARAEMGGIVPLVFLGPGGKHSLEL